MPPRFFLVLDRAVYSITAISRDLYAMPMNKLLTILIAAAALLAAACSSAEVDRSLRYVSTVAGANGEFGEAFGVAVKDGDIYVSDGQNGTIWRIHDGATTVFAHGLATPSGIAFTSNGDLIIADSGSSSIK